MYNTFNLVYDYWDEKTKKPIPNGEVDLNGCVFRDSYRFFEYYLIDLCYDDLKKKYQNENNKIKICKLNEVTENPSEKYYYVISHAFINLWEMFPMNGEKKDERLKKEILTDEIQDLLRNTDNFFVIFLYEHECDELKSLLRLKDYLNQQKIKENKFYIINNNSNIYDHKKLINTDINVHSLRFIPQTSTKVLELFKPKFLSEKNEKFFLCLNRGPKNHRLYILMYLKLSSLIEDTNWSFIPSWNHEIMYDHASRVFGDLLNHDIIFFIKKLKYKESDHETEKGIYDDKTKYQFKYDDLPPLVLVPHSIKNYENTYVNIVTESSFFESEMVHITEKSFIPFYFYQLPIIMATHNHVKRMKQNFGFDFFEDIINHDYDNEKNDQKRIKMIFKEIKRLHDQKELVKKFYKENKVRFENNHKLVLNNLYYDGDFLFLKELMQ